MEIDLRALGPGLDAIACQDEVQVTGVVESLSQVEALSPVNVDVVAAREGKQFTVDGNLDFTVVYRCSRCLESFVRAPRVPFAEVFTLDEGAADEAVHYAAGGIADLDPYVAEAVNLELEFFPVCQPSCQGLCPHCGINRNRAACNCSESRVDPRLAILSDLLSDTDSE
ncbi:MAG: DUF177 domain-containing protein [Alicyclobacillus sp.]|nr:DUF177 domain-containing protein [Alicyclobacillus sp.]